MEETVDEVSLPRERRKAAPMEYRHRAQSIIMSKSLDQLESEVAFGFYENVSLHAGSKRKLIALEVLYGFIWWTGFHGLTPFLSRPCLLALPLSWSSLSIPTTLLLSPLVLSVGMIMKCVCSPLGLLLFRLAGLLSLASHHFHSPGFRLVAINVGMASSVLVMCGSWWEMSRIDKYRKVYYFFLGFLLHLCIRVWLATFSFAFLEPLLDTSFILLAVLTSLALYPMDHRTPVIHKKEILQSVDLPPATKIEDSYPRGWVWSGVGFGALLFVMQCLFGDAALIPRWAGLMSITTGNLLESSTLLEYTSGVVVVVALCCGILLSREAYVRLLCSLPWLIVSILGLIILTQLSYITALLGGIHLAVYTSSLWFQLCQRLIESPPHKAIFIALLTYLTFISLAAIEGRIVGVSLLDCCLFLSVCLMGGSLRHWLIFAENAGKIHRKSIPTPDIMKTQRRPSYIMILGKVVRKLSTIIEVQSEEEEETDEEESDDTGLSVHALRLRHLLACEDSEIKNFDKKLKKALMVICIATLIGSAYNYHPVIYSVSPSNQGEMGVSVGGWQINAGYNLQGHPSIFRSVEIIREADPDILCLFDVMRPLSGDFDSSLWITSKLQMSAVRLPPNNQVVLMSRLPMAQSAVFTNDTTGSGVFAELIIGSQSLHVFCLQNKSLRSGSLGDVPDQVQAAVSSGHSAVLVSHLPVGCSIPTLESHNLQLFPEVSQCDQQISLHFSELTRENHTCVNHQNTTHTDMFLTRLTL